MQQKRIVKILCRVEDNLLDRLQEITYTFPMKQTAYDWREHAYIDAINKFRSQYEGTDWVLGGMKIVYVTPLRSKYSTMSNIEKNFQEDMINDMFSDESMNPYDHI